MANRDYIKRIDLDIMERLLLELYESGRSKRTTLATNTKINYDRCVKYLNCLVMLDFIKQQKDNGSVTFDLTAQGINFCKRKLGTDLSSKYEESILR